MQTDIIYNDVERNCFKFGERGLKTMNRLRERTLIYFHQFITMDVMSFYKGFRRLGRKYYCLSRENKLF